MRFVLFCAFFLFSTLSSAAAPKLEAIYGLDNDDMYLEGDKLNIVAEFDSFISPSNATSPSSMTIELDTGPDSTFTTLDLDMSTGDIVDKSFGVPNTANTNTPNDNTGIWTAENLSSGDVLLGGSFTSYEGTSTRNLVLVDIDGKVKKTFSFGAEVTAVHETSQGKIIVAGEFVNYDGEGNYDYLVQFNSDFTIDTDFMDNLTANNTQRTFNGIVGEKTRAVQSPDPIVEHNSKLYIAGNFNTVSGQRYSRVVSLNLDGTINTSFSFPILNNTSVAYEYVKSLAIDTNDTADLTDDRLFVVGYDILLNYKGSNTYRPIWKLKLDGSVDESFLSAVTSATIVSGVQVLPDYAMEGVAFSGAGLAGSSSDDFAVLKDDGSFNTDWKTTGIQAGYAADAFIIIERKLFIGAHNGWPAALGNGSLAVFNLDDGTLNQNIMNVLGTGSFDYGYRDVHGLKLLSDGGLLVMGTFRGFDGDNQIDRRSIVKLRLNRLEGTYTVREEAKDLTGKLKVNKITKFSVNNVFGDGLITTIPDVATLSGGTLEENNHYSLNRYPTDPLTSLLTVDKSKTPTTQVIKATVTAKTENDKFVGKSGDVVEILIDNPLIKLSSLTDNKDGTYSVTLSTTETTTQLGNVTAKVDGGYVQNNTSATTTLAVEFTDVLKPSATITTNKASLKKGDTATLSIAVSEVTTDLVITDFTVSGGTLSDFKGSGQDYTVVFTPTVNSFIAGSVTIPVDKFSDLASNLNTASNTLSLSIDTLPPTVAISAASTSLIAGETTTVTITLSESATDFAKSDLTVTGGTLSDFKGSGTSYTVLFTPKANSVAAGKVSIAASSFHDAMGNANEVLTEESLTIDTTVPTIDLSANKTALTVGEKATITIALSENSTNFALGDLDVVGGTLSDFKGSGKAYTVVFTPTANSIVAGKVTVAASKFSDASGNLNAVGDVINFTVDTVAPTITLTPNKTSLKNGETATITIALSEIATDFVLADLTVVGGTLSSFTGKDKAYTVLFTPTENSVVAGKVTVAANKFSDASGNTNAVGDVVNFTVDTVTPTVSLTSIEDTLLAGETTTILITLSEAATDFVLADLKVSGGKLSDFKGSGKDYTVVFTPTVDSTIAGNVNIAVGSFNDAAGNSNKTGASIDFTVDTLRPTVTDLDSDKDPLSSGNTATITIKLSENATDFALGDLQATNGTLSDLKGKDKTYTVVFTPKANSVGTGVVTVSASSFSDALGNKNLAATSLDINIDTAGPTVSLSGDKSKVIAGETLTVTFDLNEKTIDFTQNDLSVVGGSLSGFTGKDKKYSVVFTPTVNSTKAGSVTVAASSFSDALGNMNALAKTINFTVDTLVPTINLTADKSTLKQGETAAITIVLSEVATDLTKSDFTVVGGVLSDFKGSDKNYTALYTPTSSSISSGSITVSANRFTDPSGNNNAAGDSVSFSIDTAAPSVSSLTTDKSELIAGSAATITINLSEASTDFTKDDLVIIGGSISDFKGTGKVYTVVFTPQINSVAAGKVSVSASSFTDASGNTNTAGKSLDLTIDTILPTLKLTADKQNLIIGDTATITATFSEEIEDFYPIGLTVKGGALGTITGTGKVYTVVYTPAKGSTGAGSVKVGQNSFDDLLGNFNTVEETLGFTIDTEAPTISITANKTKLAVGETATLSFALSESATDFVQSDITIVGGTISNFSGSGKSYTAVYTPTASANGATGKISVAANSFNDPSGNSNAAGDSIDFVIDTLAPTISMTANKTQLVVGDTATITIVLSEAATDFALVDLSVSGGALSSFTGKDKNYSVVFTPSANTLGSGVVSVTADHFSDAAGNKNKTGDKVDFTIDTVIPTITMSADKSSVGSGDTSTIAISLNEDSINFVQNDLTVTGGTLSQFTGKDKDYSVVFTPTTNSTTAGTVTVAANAFSDKAGNLNAAGASVSYTVDTVAPTITMSSTKSSLSSGESATVSIKLSEIATDFKQTDLKVSGGTLSNFTGKDKTYSVLFTPTTGSTGTGTITVNANSFTDPIGNNNTTVEEIEFTTDTVIPTISMRADKSVLIAGETAKITIHLNKATTDFIENDLTVVGGTLSDFKGSDKDYTAVFTPTTDSIKAGKVSAAAGVFHDSIGNSNVAGAFVDFTIDTAAPTAQITADKNSLIRGDTANISITLSDAAINFTLLDMLATGGTLSDFKGTGKKYTAVFTATNDATGIGSVEIRQDSFSDIAGNLNKVTPSVNFNIDTVLPTVSLVADKTTLIVGDTATVTITLSENSITFTKSDLVVIGGTLSDFKGSGNKYTVVFTPLKGQLTNESITVEADSFTDLAGNKNADEKSVNFTVDIVPPTISLSPDKSTLSVGDTATITITLSETATDFALIDMSANGGSLSDFKGSGKSYTVVFTPSSGSSGVGKVTVNANSFKDTAGNLNAVGDSVSFTLDTVTPTISMTANKTSLKTGDTALITIKLSEASINFVKSDLSVTGGSLSDFKGTGKDYTVTFTPSSNSTTAGEVKVERDKFSDVVGNNNAVGASIDFIVDTVVPTITMSANSTDLSAGETATLTITLSETATDFALSDLSATGGTLSTFTGSGTSYTVVFTPTAGSNGAGKVTVAQDSFSDAKGNKNAAGSSVDFTIDTVVPTISMTANSTDLAVGDTATITITLSEASTNFVASDLSVMGGTLSTLTGSGTSYTVVFTPTANSVAAGKVTVAKDSFTDAKGNNNAAGASIDFTVDTVVPTIAMSANSTDLSAGETATLTITLSETATDFALSDLSATGGTLSTFTGSGKSYTVVFTPTAGSNGAGKVTVAKDSFSDAKGNKNAAGASVDFTIDTVVPTISMTATSTDLAVGDTATITITLSEASTNFVASDLSVTGGTLSTLTGSGTSYTVVFTPTANSVAAGKVTVAKDSFTDAKGNNNAAGASIDFTVDTVVPTIAMSANSTDLSAGETSTLTITLSETATDFALSDLSVTGGTLSTFTGSGTSYTVVFTPTAGSNGAGKVTVAQDSFSDAKGNKNAAGASVDFTIDTVVPTINMTANSTDLAVGDTATITITLSEASTNFVASDLSVMGGTLSTLTGSGTSYTVVFTPTANSVAAGKVTVAKDSFTDAAGNKNATEGSIDFTVDTVVPTITMSANETDLATGETATITVTLSETATDFALSDLSATGGTLSTFTGSGTSYTVVFTPTAGSNGVGKVTVAQDSFSDAKGNKNAAGASVDFTIDTVVPTISMTANSTDLAVGDTATITITLSEASTNFVASDLSVTGGTLSTLTGSGTSYTVVFTPTANSVAAGKVTVAKDSFTDAAGNKNATEGSIDFTVDTVVPTITMSANETDLAAGETATITVTLSETSTDFALSDLSVAGGTLSTFTGSGTSYTVVFTPTANSAVAGKVTVAKDSFSDAKGNNNAVGDSVDFTIDTVVPTIDMTANKTELATGETATITITLSEASTDFAESDLSVIGGSLSNFSGTGTGYTVVFTPSVGNNGTGKVTAAVSSFSDAMGNVNTLGSSIDFTIDTVVPTIDMTTSVTDLAAGETATITMTLSEASTDFALSDLTVVGGALSSFSGSGSKYTVVFTPTENSIVTGKVTATVGSFSDAAGNTNTVGDVVDIIIDTVLPTADMKSDKNALGMNDTATITITLSETSTDFTESDLSVVGGTLSSFSGTDKVYTVIFTPKANSTVTGKVTVSSDSFSDPAGNKNTEEATVEFDVDTVLPLTPTVDELYTNKGNPTLSGLAEADNKVFITIEGVTFVTQSSANKDAQGFAPWVLDTANGVDSNGASINFTALSNGVYDITAHSIDVFNNQSLDDISDSELMVDTFRPNPPVIFPVVAGEPLSGRGEPNGSIVLLNFKNEEVCARSIKEEPGVTISEFGFWSCHATSKLDANDTIQATVRDKAENVSNSSQVVVNTRDDSHLHSLVVSPSLGSKVSGFGEYSAKVTVRNSAGDDLCMTYVDPITRWECNFSVPLNANENIYVTQTLDGKTNTPVLTHIIDTSKEMAPPIIDETVGTLFEGKSRVSDGDITVVSSGSLVCSSLIKNNITNEFSCLNSSGSLDHGEFVYAFYTSPAPVQSSGLSPAIVVGASVRDSDLDGRTDMEEWTCYSSIASCMDTDGDGIPNYLDTDDDGDGIPSALEDGLNYLSLDSDGDGIPDSEEIKGSVTFPELSGKDKDNDGIDDAIDVDYTGGNDTTGDGIDDIFQPIDTDGDGLPDYIDEDSDGDSIPDAVESTNDFDGDGLLDYLDVDADNDGIKDYIEAKGNAYKAPVTRSHAFNRGRVQSRNLTFSDFDGDGLPDYLDLDSDNDGIPDSIEAGILDDDKDGIMDENGTPALAPLDSDGDGLYDHIDLDSNNDGIFDLKDSGVAQIMPDGTPIDSDHDGMVDDHFTDVDGDGVKDPVDGQVHMYGSAPLAGADTDGDGIQDSIDRDDDNDTIPDLLEGSLDIDGDGIPNHLDLDSDNDGISDLLEQMPHLDLNHDGVIDTMIDNNKDGLDDRAFTNMLDSDGDGTADIFDLDSDNDLIFDLVEAVGMSHVTTLIGLDANHDGQIDNMLDIDADGISDVIDANIVTPTGHWSGDERAEIRLLDTDNDGLRDFQDEDSDNDGYSDYDEYIVDPSLGNMLPYQLDRLNTAASSGGSIGVLSLLSLLLLSIVRNRNTSFVLSLVMLSILSVNTARASSYNTCGYSEEGGFESCWYGLAGIGVSTLEPEEESQGWYADDASGPTSWNIGVGYHFSPRWFVEAGYVSLGDAELINNRAMNVPSVYSGTETISYAAPSVSLGAYLFKPEFSPYINVYGKLGASMMMHDTSDSRIKYSDENNIQVNVGGGIQLRPGKSPWFLRLEANYYDTDAMNLGISIGRYFGAQKKTTTEPVADEVLAGGEVRIYNTYNVVHNHSIDKELETEKLIIDYYGFGESQLGKEAQLKLDKLIENALSKTKYVVYLNGHTDFVGTDESNDQLSLDRANDVKRYLIEKGLNSDWIFLEGHGERKPRIDNYSEASRALNRRVEVIMHW